MIRRNNDGSEANSSALAAAVQGKVQQQQPNTQRMAPTTTTPSMQSIFVPSVNTNPTRQFGVASQNQVRSGSQGAANSSAGSGLARILTTTGYLHQRTNLQSLPPPASGFQTPHLQQALNSAKQQPSDAGGPVTRPVSGTAAPVPASSPQRKHGGPVAAPRVKRMKLEERSEQELVALRAAVAEYRLKEMASIKSVFNERVTELFFLQNGGNMVDMIAWKKRPGPHLATHLRTQNLDSEDEEATLVMTPPGYGTSAAAVFPQPTSAGSSVVANTTDVKPTKVQLGMAAAAPSSVPSPTSSLSVIPTPSAHGSQPLSVEISSPKLTAPVGATVPPGVAVVDEKPPHGLESPQTSSTRDAAASTSVNAANAVTVTSPAKSPRTSGTAASPVGRLPTRQRSISAVYDSTIGSQEEIVERAKQEAYVMQRIAELRKEGLWSERRLPKVQEPPRNKAHWDYLLEEMVWLATDFAQERKWKKSTAKKCAKMCQKFHMEQKLKEERAEKEAEQKLRRIASGIAKDIKQFWSNVEKLVEFKQQSWLEEKRKKALDLHLNFIMDQTEKYSSWLTQGMNKAVAESGDTSMVSSVRESRASSPATSCNASHSDADFEPASEESDDEETIAKSEESENTSHEGHLKEIEALQREGELPLSELLKGLPPEIVKTRAAIVVIDSSSDEEMSTIVAPPDDSKSSLVDADFKLSVVDDSTDDEDTIIEQEKAEKGVDHSQELKDLQDEGEMPFEELWKKYSGAYVNDSAESNDSESSASSDVSESSDNETEEGSEDEDGKVADDNLDIGLESLINPVNREASRLKTGDDLGKGPSKEISDIAAAAERFQPKGYTYSTAQVVTKVPFLLKHQLREYQHIGLDWLVTMYDRKLNGILADEMGLGKTIQTIALLAHLACEKSNWGPHLIVVPTSVMLNWEMEIKKWCPAFKILTYYGTQKERKQKRQGWTKPNFFHICITSYKLVIQDHQSFRRKRWKYFILDEAQNIKNFKSQRWQLLLNFQSQRRLLLTGTPLQNSLMELWSLMHFLMPNVFQSHRDFKEWFANPVSGMIEGSQEYNEGLIKRLHKVLRPFLLRRIKSEVEKQLPMKYEHIVFCRLSKRQRFLYDDFMSQSKTKETLATGNFMSVINVLMQLRKVCNHPNLFEARPTISPFQMEGIRFLTASLAESALDYNPFKHVNLCSLNLLFADLELSFTAFAAHQIKRFQTPRKLIEEVDTAPDPPPRCPAGKIKLHVRTAPSTPQTPKYSVNLNTTPQKIAISRTASPAAGTANTKTVVSPQTPVSASSPLPQMTGITLQLVQQPSPGGISVAQLTTSQMVTSTPITVQLQQTQQGPRLTVPPGQLAQITVTQNQKLPQVPVTTAWSQILVPSSSGSFTQLVPSTISTITTTAGTSSATGKTMIKISPAVSNVPPVVAGLRSSTRAEVEKKVERDYTKSIFHLESLDSKRRKSRGERLQRLAKFSNRRCEACPIYGGDLIQAVNVVDDPVPVGPAWRGSGYVHCLNAISNLAHPPSRYWSQTDTLHRTVLTPEKLLTGLRDIFSRFVLVVPAVMAPPITVHVSHPPPSRWLATRQNEEYLRRQLAPKADCLHPISGAMTTQFPDPRLIQYDCGKLQVLDRLLRQLKAGTHRVLIFTQMTRMLDVLEQFLNFHGHIYLRLDGATKVEQRQFLMERFNADRRIFCFILSTRSGGIGVNLTGADTVIFYDSDWNPTMDAQAQDRCHRIGQTRDVHIYRLVSERTVEENILRKANQKRLLGEVAIEGGNFTTAFFRKHTLKELFDMTFEESKKQEEIVRVVPPPVEKAADDITTAQLEHALAQAEEDTDVDACKTAKAEAAAELAEFDESISLDGFDDDSSKLDEELASQMTPIERYAMAFLESTQDAFSLEQLKQAEEEIEAQKKDWELGRLQALKEEEERRAQLEDDDIPYTYSREDAYNQVYISLNTREQMPMWAPPTPPQEENDVFIDYTLCFLFEPNVLPESQLPPVYVHKEQKRSRADAAAARKQKVRREDAVCVPRSLFDRPSAAVLKMRRDLKLHRIKSVIRSQPTAGYKAHHQPGIRSGVDGDRDGPDWLVHEDWALLQAVQGLQELPLNLTVLSPAHTPNWDLVAEVVNATSCSYRSPKQCKSRYDCVVIPREEGRVVYDANAKKQKKAKNLYRTKSNRTMRTSQLFVQDNNSSLSQLFIQRFEVVKAVASKRTPTLKLVNPTHRNPKHSAILADNHINYDQPLTPVQLAANRAERIAREKKIQQTALVPQAIPAVAPQVAQNVPGVSSPQVASQQQLQPVVSRALTAQGQSSVSAIPNARTQRNVPAALTMQDMLAVASHSRGVQQGTSSVTQAVVSPAQMTPQRVSVAPAPSPPGPQNPTASAAQLQLLRNPALYKQQRLQVAQQQASGQKVSTSGVTTVQVSQQQRAQAPKQNVKQTVSRPMTEIEMAQLMKNRQQKVGQVAQIQVPPQGQAQLQQMQQHQTTSPSPVATLVKTVSAPTSMNAGSPGVPLPVGTVTMGGVNINLSIPAPQGKTAAAKGAAITAHQQQQLQHQIKLQQRKLQLAQIQGKNQLSAQLGTVQILQQQSQGHKTIPATVTVQQIQQVMKQVQPQNLGHLSQVPSSSLTAAGANVTQPQVLSHTVLAKPATVTLSQPPAPSTVAGSLHAGPATLQARMIHAGQTNATTVSQSQVSSIKQAIHVVTAGTGGLSHTSGQIHQAQLRNVTASSPGMAVDSQGRVQTIVSSPSVTVALPSSSSTQQSTMASNLSQQQGHGGAK